MNLDEMVDEMERAERVGVACGNLPVILSENILRLIASWRRQREALEDISDNGFCSDWTVSVAKEAIKEPTDESK